MPPESEERAQPALARSRAPRRGRILHIPSGKHSDRGDHAPALRAAPDGNLIAGIRHEHVRARMVRAVGPRTPPWIDLHVPGPALQLLSQLVELVSRRAVQPDLDAWPIAPAWLPDPGGHISLAAHMMRPFPDSLRDLAGCVHVTQQRPAGLP